MSKKSTKALASATLMSLVLTTALSGAPVKAAAGQVSRIGEADRYSTAAKVATENWKTSDNVVLVSGEGYADAVSASALAKKLDAPILLTTAGSLNSDTKEALTKLSAKNIYVVGGKASVSASVRAELKAKYTVEELGGLNRYETNAAVAQKLVDLGVDASNAIMVGGEGFSDALSVAPVAAAKGQILLLGMNDANYMKPVLDFVAKNKSKVTVVGTKNVISDSILAQVNGTRIDGGKDRWDTNLKVLAAFKDAVKMDKMFVASASYNSKDDGYADALVASALAGKTASPLVLLDKDTNEGTTNAVNYIKTNADVKKTEVNVIGGKGVVSEATVDAINKAMGIVKPNPGNHTVASVEAVSLNQIKVHFNCAIDSDSAEDEANYKIDGTDLKSGDDNDVTKDTNGAVATAIDSNTVLITLATPRKQYDNVSVSVKKSILTEDKEETVDAFDTNVTFSDTTVPTLKNVTVEGNSQLTVEFSEAVNMGDGTTQAAVINNLKNKFKIDGQSIGNYGVNQTYSEAKDKLVVDKSLGNGKEGTWSNKILFYFDSAIPAGNHTLKISDGENNNGVLSDAAGFTFKETTKDFTVENMGTKPTVKSVKEVSSGEVHITFDRPMDIKTAKKEAKSNYEINETPLSKIDGCEIKTAENDTVIKLKHVGDAIKTGSNTLYIKDTVKDAFGNKVPDDTRVNFDDIKDETKPTVKEIKVIDSETIRVRFSKDVSNSYARNLSNYKLQDNKNVDITSHIKAIYSTEGETATGNSATYNIKMWKNSDKEKAHTGAMPAEDWRLTSSKYTLTIKNVQDTATKPNIMEEFVYNLNGTDDVAPRGIATYGKLRGNGSTKDKVIVYFSEPMDSATLQNKDNFKFVNGEGDTKPLPGDATISIGGDSKSAIIEFSTSYHVVRVGETGTTTNHVKGVIATNVKDEAGNMLDGVAFDNGRVISMPVATTAVKVDTMKLYYDGNDTSGDLKADVQFDRAVDDYDFNDFTLGGVVPSSGNHNGDKITLIFSDDSSKVTDAEKAIYKANGGVKENPSKIDVVKAQGQHAILTVNPKGTTDETGASVVALTDTKENKQNTIYDYAAAPKTTGDKEKPEGWKAVTNGTSAEISVVFDTLLDTNSGVKTDDFTFAGSNGTDLKADNVVIKGNTVVFTFNNKQSVDAIKDTVKVSAKNTVSIRTARDRNDGYATYKPSSDDIKPRTVKVTRGPVTPDTKPTINVVNKPEYSALGYVQIQVNDVKALDKVYVNNAVKEIADGFIDKTNNTIKVFCDEYSKIELLDKSGNKVLAYEVKNPDQKPEQKFEAQITKYVNTFSVLNLKVTDASLVKSVVVDGKEITDLTKDANDKTKLVVKNVANEPTTVNVVLNDGTTVKVK